ncbi:hypothetical protein [Streptomyces iconiensis]|uniref:Uncharacterized protein n=1 Tax=Streptomyces iconiensis TaxID=1384038 RepID=A0ABT7AAY9_9ACTN|nr:hypothetical protein [Streptomyces iconiensis]MDJ1138159.1 hypothetical protein [Streptomyces iconiensis]
MLIQTPTPPPRWPEPVPGCPVCGEYGRRRGRAYRERDYSGATDANVLLVRHKRQEHG